MSNVYSVVIGVVLAAGGTGLTLLASGTSLDGIRPEAAVAVLASGPDKESKRTDHADWN